MLELHVAIVCQPGVEPTAGAKAHRLLLRSPVKILGLFVVVQRQLVQRLLV
jgi:hypothetical protein